VADGLRVVGLASSGDEEWVSALGASEVLSRGTDLSSIGPVDAVLDAVPLGVEAIAPVRPGGVAVFTRRIPDLPADPGVRVETPLVESDQAALVRLTRDVAAGRLRTRVARVLALEDAAEAHRLVERGGLRGKVVLELDRR
jgi:NADPH:quinone reductase-like Zn-dependent oxidoreductase